METLDDVKHIIKTEATPYKNKKYNVKDEQEMRSLIRVLTKDAVNKEVHTSYGAGSREVFHLKDGSRVQVRSTSTTGGVTVDVFNTGNNQVMKVHIEPKS